MPATEQLQGLSILPGILPDGERMRCQPVSAVFMIMDSQTLHVNLAFVLSFPSAKVSTLCGACLHHLFILEAIAFGRLS